MVDSIIAPSYLARQKPTMSIPETPTKIGQMVDGAINRLNGTWDLHLPRLHGRDADPLREDESLSRKCSSLIRYLCFKTDSINGILNQFDTDILQLFSDWQWKPSQTPGTLPALPVTKSAIHRDLARQHGSGPVQLTKKNRKRALNCLHNMLLEEYNLTKMSDSYNRTLGPPDLSPTAQSSQFSFETAHEVPGASSAPTPSTPDPMTNPPGEPSLKYRDGQPSKRTMSSSKSSPKRQQRGSKSFVPRSDLASSDPRFQSISYGLVGCPDLKFREDQKTRNHQGLPISFTTEASSKQSAIFSDVEPQQDSLSISSNDTSMVSSPGQLTEDLLPTQEFDELMKNGDFRRSIHQELLPVASSCPPSAPFENNSPQSKSLFQKHDLPPVGNNFILAYEIERLASPLNIKPTEFWSYFDHGPSNLTPADFWLQTKMIRSKHKSRPLLTKSPLEDWTGSDKKRRAGSPERSLALSGSLEWNDPKDSTLFKLSLNPVQREQSCRFHRKFGSDRFLVLSIPILSETPAGAKHPSNQQSLHEWICNFLATESLEIAGRHWRVFFVAHDKARRKKKSKENEKFNGRLKLHLFAEYGCGISQQRLCDLRNVDLAAPFRISVEDMMWWHMPLDHDLESTDLKLFSRINLGLSKTTPTLALQPHEFIYEPDDPTKPVMNDGCALMSYGYAKAIWKAYGGSGVAPSAFQGRIGGAKGLWLVDYTDKHDKVSDRGYWIEISDSQLKIKPHPRDRPDSDDFQRTFELLKYSSNATEGHLNNQLINILDDRGVPRDVLDQFLIADMVNFPSTLAESMRAPEALRLWMKEHFPRNPASKLIGVFPADKAEQCNTLVEAGFEPRANPMILDCVNAIVDDFTTKYVEKLRIKLPCSTTVFCAPDPTGLLRPGEVYLGFSQEKIDPRSGLCENVLRNINVLVARNPAYLSSDMQLRRAVHHDGLRHYKDVILFSTEGDTPLASLLSGGDYDGDTVTVI